MSTREYDLVTLERNKKLYMYFYISISKCITGRECFNEQGLVPRAIQVSILLLLTSTSTFPTIRLRLPPPHLKVPPNTTNYQAALARRDCGDGRCTTVLIFFSTPTHY